ncbi:hypothetical protein D3C78_557350 [compost metagenome]
MYKIEEDNSLETIMECLPLAFSHYNEVEAKSEKIPFNINWKVLESLSQAGMLSLIVAREEGEVVGYFASLVTEDFMTSQTTGKELAIYVSPEHRGGRLFYRLLQASERALVERGVTTQYITFKAGHHVTLPLRCGFEHTETTYQKILGV